MEILVNFSQMASMFLGGKISITIPHTQEEGGISKPNKFVVNETKNKFDNQLKPNPDKQNEAPVQNENVNCQEKENKNEKKKEDNCLIN
jgi:hypothetical protein